MALEKEIETYNQHLDSLIPNQGKFVLIQGDDLIDVFVAYEDALKAGYHQFGVATPFLVKKIQAVDQVQVVTRLLGVPCHI